MSSSAALEAALIAKMREIVSARTASELDKILNWIPPAAAARIAEKVILNPEDELPPAEWYAVLADLRRATAAMKEFYDARVPIWPPSSK